MKVESKWFLSAVSVFIVAIVLTALTSFGSIRANTSNKPNEVLVSSITKVGNID